VEWVSAHQRFLTSRLDSDGTRPLDFSPEAPWMERLHTLKSPRAPVLDSYRRWLEARMAGRLQDERAALAALRNAAGAQNREVRDLAAALVIRATAAERSGPEARRHPRAG
jgi:hypothetical protein